MSPVQVQMVTNFCVAVDPQTNLHSLIQHDQPVHVCDIEMGAAVQPLEESSSSVPKTGNEPVTIVPLDKENNVNKITKGNKTMNIPSTPSNDVEFDISNVQVAVSSVDVKIFHCSYPTHAT